MSRTIAIGDIHGCSLALATLLDAIRPTPDDVLVTLGDYIDRGPDSRGVLDQLLALRDQCRLIPLLGNHEEMLLAALRDNTALRLWLTCGGRETVGCYSMRLRLPTHPDSLRSLLPEEHLLFLQSCRAYHETEAHIFLHANYAPDRPLEQQTAEMLRWEFLDPATARPHSSGKTAIVGHTPQLTGGILDLGFLCCIDTFCHGGGWLTALDVNTGQTWQADMSGRMQQQGGAGTAL